MPTDEPQEPLDTGGESAGVSLTPGELLQQERLRRGLGEKEVADELHITMRYIKALEANDFDKLPGAVFARGYIKNYASLLHLDAGELIRLYEEIGGSQSAASDPQVRNRTRRKMDRNQFWVVVSVIVFVTGFMLLWLYNNFVTENEVEGIGASSDRSSLGLTQDSDPQLTSPVRAGSGQPRQSLRSSKTTAIAIATEPGSEQVTTANFVESLATIAKNEPLNIALDVDRSTREVLDDIKPAVTVAEAAVEIGRLIEINSPGEDLLKITFSGESWIEVNNSESGQIYRDLRVAGDVVEITGNAPFNILLGDAPFIQLSLNGEEIDVSDHIRIDNSARLTVGL